MYKYNLKGFFKDTIVQNDEFVSNGHFIFNKSILTTGQRKMVEAKEQDVKRLEGILPIIKQTKEYFEGLRNQLEFVPESVVEDYTFKSETYNILHNKELELALKEDYYNFFISKGCKLYKGNGSINPLSIIKDGEFVGVLLPVRIDKDILKNAIDYNTYITRLKQEQQAKEELKKLNKKCLYIVDNKAVIRNKPLKSVLELTGNDNYKNLWIDAIPDKFNDVSVYIDFEIVFMEIMVTDINTIKDEPERRFGDGFNQITLGWYKDQLNKRIESNDWINVAEVKLMELAGEPEEYINSLNLHRKHVKELIRKKEEERELKKQQEEQEYVNEKNKIADDMITHAEQSILDGNKVINRDITIYESMFKNNTISLVLHLMKQYDIKVPLKTQGWINSALYSVYRGDDGEFTYDYYNSSSNSTVFSKYLDMLVDKIKEKYKTVA